MDTFTPNFETADQLIEFLEETLIPDLRESGSDSMADDFEECIYYIERCNHLLKQQ